MSKKLLYSVILLVSLLLFVLSFTVLANTKWMGGISVGVGIYLLLGALIKLCKTNDRLKKTVICAIDLLCWLP